MVPNRTIILAAAVLLSTGCGFSASPGTGGQITPIAAAPQRELLPDQQVQQVLNRFAFGGRPGDAERVRAMGVDRWIALQLEPQRIDDRATDRVIASYDMLDAPTSQIVSSFRKVREARRRMQQRSGGNAGNAGNGGSSRSRRDVLRELARNDPAALEAALRVREALTDVQSAKLARAVGSERQLQEVMVDFWENHFSVFAGKGQTRLYLASYDRDAIRPNALGKFRELLGAVARSPAMLYYLDNWRSAADSSAPRLIADGSRRRVPAAPGPTTPHRRPAPPAARPATPRTRPASPATTPIAPRTRRAAPTAQRPASPRRSGLNENYGRELMELHTLGVDGGYTQHDVIEVARAFTGWTIDPRNGTFVFRPEIHDAGEKVVLGHRLAAGRGMQDGEDVLDILASSPATARFIARKLVTHFVSDAPPSALVERVARSYMRTGGDIREMLRTIATSPELFSRAAYRAKVKTPFELVASSLRAMGAAPDTTPRTALIVARLGQPIFGRQTPDGWPDHGDAWMNTGAILERINFGLALAGGRIPGASLATWPYTPSLGALGHEQQVDGVIRAILGGEASPATRNVLVSGENPLVTKYADSASSRLSFADEDILDGSDDAMSGDGTTTATRFPMQPATQPANPHSRRRPPLTAAPSSAGGLARIVGLALGAPEFQRR